MYYIFMIYQQCSFIVYQKQYQDSQICFHGKHASLNTTMLHFPSFINYDKTGLPPYLSFVTLSQLSFIISAFLGVRCPTRHHPSHYNDIFVSLRNTKSSSKIITYGQYALSMLLIFVQCLHVSNFIKDYRFMESSRSNDPY